jgi:hypothetical protein
MTYNFDIGAAGLVKCDVDKDGDTDLLLPVGDNLEDSHSIGQPYHGCLWLENKGGWSFDACRIATFPGTYAADAGDLDGDGDQDVALCSMAYVAEAPESPSLAWLENDGRQQFTLWPIANEPRMLVTVACGDLNADGQVDVVAGGLHMYPPFERVGRVSAWTSGRPRGAADRDATRPVSTPRPGSSAEAVPPPGLDRLDALTRADSRRTPLLCRGGGSRPHVVSRPLPVGRQPAKTRTVDGVH